MGLLRKRIKGATIIEAIVSMMIIMVVFVMFVMIYINVMSADNGPKKMKALTAINELSHQARITGIYTDTVVKQDSLTIFRNVKQSNSDNNMVLTLKVVDKKGNVIARQNEIIAK
jgi:hypothetical protein